MNEIEENTENSYVLDNDPAERVAYKEKAKEQPMGDVYDVYSKTVGVHSKLSKMSEDYTLTRYDVDIYNEKFPKFIREQRKILRIIKSYLIIPKSTLSKFYNTKELVNEIYEGLKKEYNQVEELLGGELDECVVMARTPKGEVIKALLQHGLNSESREIYDTETENPSISDKLRERNR